MPLSPPPDLLDLWLLPGLLGPSPLSPLSLLLPLPGRSLRSPLLPLPGLSLLLPLSPLLPLSDLLGRSLLEDLPDLWLLEDPAGLWGPVHLPGP